MRFNQFSYLALPRDTIIFELKKYGPLYDFSIIALSAPPTIGGS